jgi:hypothetical protein
MLVSWRMRGKIMHECCEGPLSVHNKSENVADAERVEVRHSCQMILYFESTDFCVRQVQSGNFELR